MPTDWRVVPLSPGQLLDVRPEDALEGGLYRACETYRGGGGYDRFPEIALARLGVEAHRQFVVQLWACVLDCPYCYVTREGVWGRYEERTTRQLVTAYLDARQEVFHLMGGAPAIYLDRWPELLAELEWRAPRAIFHSDLMAVEGAYDAASLRAVSRGRVLYAVDVKGLTAEEFERNTRKPFPERTFHANLALLERERVPAYVTYTAVDPANVPAFERQYPWLTRDAFHIDLIEYEAVPHVDDVPWGATGGRD